MSYTVALQNDTAVARAASGSTVSCVEPTDNQMVEAVLAGDEAAFEYIFDKYKRLAICITGRYFRKPEEMEEIVQTVFMKVYFELPKFRGEHDLSLASWISRIASNTCLDVVRKQKRRPEDLAYDLPDVENVLLTIADTHDGDCESRLIDRDLANKLLAHLDPVDRVILQMLHSEGMNIGESARLMGWTESRLKMRAWRARRVLRDLVAQFV
jgi:RNA polymerase sigma-70 factor, ECF subfamily